MNPSPETIAGLTLQRIAARAEATAIVFLLHGVTYPGDQLMPMAEDLSRIDALAHVEFVVPHGPVALDGFAEGRSWWPVSVGRIMRMRAKKQPQDLTHERADGMDATRAQFAALIDAIAGDRPFAIVGFSQGAMLAVDYALKAAKRPAALALLAGTIVGETDWRTHLDAARGLRILMTHGHDDDVLPFDIAVRLRDLLRAAGADVAWLEYPGGHEIPPAAADAVAALLCETLGAASASNG